MPGRLQLAEADQHPPETVEGTAEAARILRRAPEGHALFQLETHPPLVTQPQTQGPRAAQRFGTNLHWFTGAPLQQRFEPAQPFVPSAVTPPVPPDRRGDLQADSGPAVIGAAPLECCPQVVVLQGQARETGSPCRAVERRLDFLRRAQVELRVPSSESRPEIRPESLVRVLTRRFEKTIALCFRQRRGHGRDERAVDQTDYDTQDLFRGKSLDTATDGFQCGECEAAPEYREALEQETLRRCQQVVAPIEGGLERMVMGRGRAALLFQQIEYFVEMRNDLLDRQHPGASGHHLDGERQTIEAPAHIGDRRCIGGRESKRRVGGCRALDEQADRVEPADIGGVRRRIRY